MTQAQQDEGLEELNLEALDTRKGANEGHWLRLRHPITNRLSASRIRILGMDSDRYEAKTWELARRRQNELAEAQGVAPAMTAEVIHERNRELVAACVIGWERIKGAPEYKGEASALELLKRMPWIYEQVNAAIVNRANFLPGSETS